MVIEDEVENVIQDPLAGEGKKGDLAGFRVHKFSFQRQNFLIAYQSQSDGLVFYSVGSHENFYRELKNYVKEMG